MKTVIITGANGHLGSTVTRHLLNKGYKVIATVHKQQSKEEFPPHQNLDIEIVDLSKEEEASRFVQKTIEKNKNVDGALLLVGGFTMGNVAATGSGDIRRQISLNFDTAYHIARPLFQHMLENNNGRIVFIGSRPALNANDGKNLIAYGLSKSLLFKLAEFLNAEAKGKKVTATVVAPSTIDTPLNRKEMPNANPDNWVQPQELAEIFEFVLSDTGNSLRETVLKVYGNS